MAIIQVPDSVKAIRDTLAAVQSGKTPDQDQRRIIAHLIADLDAMRPLNTAGEHVAHTNLCGCRPVRLAGEPIPR